MQAAAESNENNELCRPTTFYAESLMDSKTIHFTCMYI
jgi:hypothetical protein